MATDFSTMSSMGLIHARKGGVFRPKLVRVFLSRDEVRECGFTQAERMWALRCAVLSLEAKVHVLGIPIARPLLT